MMMIALFCYSAPALNLFGVRVRTPDHYSGLPTSGHYWDYSFDYDTDYGNATTSGISSSFDG